MKDKNKHPVELSEFFEGVVLKIRGGNKIRIDMKDNTFHITVIHPELGEFEKKYFVSMETGEIRMVL